MLLFCVPLLTQAAGFAKQSLFLSQSAVYEGQTVFIYAVVTDDKPTYFNGELRFSDEKELIGSVPVSLEPGHASTLSVPWKPSAGEYKITAALVTSDGKPAESQEATFYVNGASSSPRATGIDPLSIKPKTEKAKASPVDSSAPILNTIGRVSPAFADALAPTFFSVDTFRKERAKSLDQGSEWSKKEISKAATAPSGTTNTLWLILTTFVLYLCASLVYFLGNIGIFYPAIAIAFFFLLWKIYSWVRN